MAAIGLGRARNRVSGGSLAPSLGRRQQHRDGDHDSRHDADALTRGLAKA
jgi:hypothetical protein